MNWTVCTDGSDRIKKVRVDLRKLALGLTACSNGLQSKENVEVVVVVDSWSRRTLVAHFSLTSSVRTAPFD